MLHAEVATMLMAAPVTQPLAVRWLRSGSPGALAVFRNMSSSTACPPVRCRFPCHCADGADLMLPGIQPEAVPPLPAGAACSLRVPGNPAPIAVRCGPLADAAVGQAGTAAARVTCDTAVT